MKENQLRNAKATLSRVLDDAVAGKPAIVTRHGKREGVLLSYADYEKLSRKPSLGWLLANSSLAADDLPVRKSARD